VSVRYSVRPRRLKLLNEDIGLAEWPDAHPLPSDKLRLRVWSSEHSQWADGFVEEADKATPLQGSDAPSGNIPTALLPVADEHSSNPTPTVVAPQKPKTILFHCSACKKGFGMRISAEAHIMQRHEGEGAEVVEGAPLVE
jgi:hypothetical protein